MATIKISQLNNSNQLSGTEVLPIVQNNDTVKTTVQDIADLASGGGAGLEGTNYIYVKADGTDTENALALFTAYATAKTMSPSATNRITIVCGLGYYNFGSTAFVMDTQYIDLVSLDGNRSIIFNSANAAGTISITANDVFVKGVDVGTKAFTIATSLNLLRVENCKGGNGSFGNDITIVSGTFIDCVGGNGSFGSINSSALVTVSGTFINCIAGSNSFGNGDPNVTGTFTNCVGGVACFGNPVSFSVNGFSGTATNCVGGNSSFGGGSGGTQSTGIYNNCVGGAGSFSSSGPVGLQGKLFYCRITSGTFGTVSGAGITRLCLDGSNVENNQG